MNGIIGMTSLLLESSLSEAQRSEVKVIATSCDTLLTLVNDILDFSKIEAGKIALERVSFSVRESASEIVDLFRSAAHEKGLTLDISTEETLQDWIKSDVTRFKQVLMNLTSNAIKFTEVGGVSVHASSRKIDERRHEIRVSVRDTGIGVPEAARARLFKPFSQADASTTRRFGGTGLGLSISSGLVEAMGGTIGVTSEEGEGSTFYFTIIADEARSGERGGAASDFARIDPKMAEKLPLAILIADDHPVNQSVARRFLEKLGYRADCAHNGLEVLRALEQRSYDVILMDCSMPEMDGFEATARVIEVYGAARPKIIAMTANSMDEDRERCRLAGMDGFVSKPIRISDVVRALREVFPDAAIDDAASVSAPGRAKVTASSRRRGIDRDRLFANFRGDEDILRGLIASFLKSAPAAVQSIAAAIERGDAEALSFDAHTLKGAVSNFYCEEAREAAFELEKIGKSGVLDPAPAALARLRLELDALYAELAGLVSSM